MGNIPGMKKPDIHALPQIKDRITFVYLEHCKINRRDSAIIVTNQDGVTDIPAGLISVLILGPGTDISHRAVELIGDAGVTIVWTGEHGVRYYASGRALTHRSGLLIKQAELVSNQRKHVAVARKMYEMRFPNEDVSKLTMQQLRGKEGARVRRVYQSMSKKWGVPWTGRDYKPDDFEASDVVNQALSVGNACLYGLAHAVIAALGCSPGLGFVHVGHECSFVYDIADLYKAQTTIPLAFEVASQHSQEIEPVMRHKMRDIMVSEHLLAQMVKDIKYLLNEEDPDEQDIVYLWDNKVGQVKNGISY